MNHKKPLIVFDIGNVLLRFSLERAARNFDRIEPGVGRKLIKDLWGTRFGNSFEEGKISGRAVYDHVKKKHGLSMSFPQFCAAFNDIFSPVQEHLRLLKDLSRRYPTAILSNTNALHWKYMFKRYPAMRAARWPYGSHLAGAMKPSRRIFHSLARHTKVPLREMIFIDDRPEHVAAALKLGMRAIHYRGRGSVKKLLLRFLKTVSLPAPAGKGAKRKRVLPVLP